MTPMEMFKATMPFVRIKLAIELAFLLLKVLIAALFIWGVVRMYSAGVYYDVNPFETGYRNFAVAAMILLVLYPPLNFAVRRYFGYLVRVGHIAVTARIINTGKVPKNQKKFGYAAVRKNFLRANVFFAIDRLTHRAVLELQAFVQSMLGGLGVIALLANMFKKNLVSHIDDCCLGLTFLREDIKPLTGAVIGVCVYVRSWREMAKQAVTVTLEALAVRVIFYLAGGAWLVFAAMSRNIASIVSALFVIFVAGALKRGLLDSYIMVNMLTTFYHQSKKIGSIEESKPTMEKATMVSPAFCNLVYHANESERFLDEEEQKALLANRRIGIAMRGSEMANMRR